MLDGFAKKEREMVSKKRGRWVALLGLLSAGSLILSACATPTPEVVERVVTQVVKETVKETVIVEGTPEVVEKVVTATPVPQEPLIVAVSAGPKELDPDFGESTSKGNILRQLFDTPTWYDDQGVLHPSVFESWEILNEGKTYRFRIREGIRFWSGNPLDAQAAKFTFDRMLDPDMLEAGANNNFPSRVGLVDTEVVDDYTLDMHLEAPSVLVPMRLYVVYMLDPDYYQSASLEETATTPGGSGPYKLEEFVPDDHITLVRNEDYWRGVPEVEKIIIRIVPERSSRIAMLETGEAHVAMDLVPDDMALVEGIPHARLSWIEGARRMGLAFNQKKPYLQDKRVRQAFNYAVDWDSIKDNLLGGLGGRATTYRGTSFWANPDLNPYPHDAEKALELLDEAGFPMDQPLTIDVDTRYSSRVQVTQAVAAQFRELGLDVTVNPVEYSVFRQMVFDRDFHDMVFLGLGGRGVPMQDAGVFAEGAMWNPTSWVDEDWEEFEELRLEMLATFDEDRQKEISQQLEAITYDACPWVWLYHDLVIAGVDKSVDWDVRIDGQLFFYWAGWAE
jgi:peptide/nickel transport system substrate-binding protein